MRAINKLKHEYAKKKNYLFEKKCQKRLTNDNFSIICSNCIGGIIYHRLNKEFLSPTINLWMDQKDFLKMVSDLKYYMSLDLCFDHSFCDYPVASIDDIKIHFNHYKSEDEALDCWERRKNRINYDNLYVIMYDRDGISERDFDTLAKVNCKNKVILSSRRYNNYDFIKTLQPNVNATHGELFLNTDSCGMREFEKQWDFIEWLNK